MSTSRATMPQLYNLRDENNILIKQLEQYKREHGELLLKNSEARDQLAESSAEVNRLRNELLSTSHVTQVAKEERDAKVRELSTEVNMLKKINCDLSEENRSVEEMKAKCAGELRELRFKIARVEQEKEEIRRKEKEEKSRVLARNEVLQKNYDNVVIAATGRFLTLKKRLTKLEEIVESLQKDDSSNAGSQLIDTAQVLQEQESFGPEPTPKSVDGVQCHEPTPMAEKTASSIPSPKAVSATCVKGQPGSYESDTRPTGPVTEEKSASSMPFNHKSSPSLVIDLCCSDDDGDIPLTNGLKRKLPSSDVSCKVGDHDSFSIYRSKEQNDLSLQSINPSKKTMSALKPCQQKSREWDYEADLLDDLRMDTELCMKGVCALYRQLKLCTPRETKLAMFLTDGHAKGELKKTPADIQNDPELGRDYQRIAVMYSKQLFDIYKNGKDPLFSHDTLFC